VTLCIAAKCDHLGQDAIVMASDLRIEDDVSGSETACKQAPLIPGWYFMYAGIQARAAQLVISVREHLETNPLGYGHITKTFKEAAREHREKLVDEYVHSQIARSYAWLLSEGHKVLPQEYYAQLIQYVSAVRFDAQLIVCGFSNESAVICLIDESRGEPVARPIENFAAIGSGSTVAESVLHQRVHRMDTPLKQALYHIYEAKRLGEAAPGVGHQTTIRILLADGRTAFLTEAGVSFVQRCYDRYAPKPLEGVEDWEESTDSFIEMQAARATPQLTTRENSSQPPSPE